MRTRLWLSLALAAAVAACGTPPAPPQGTPAAEAPAALPPDGQVYPRGNPYRVLAAEELPVVAVTVDSQLSTLPKERLVDGNLSTQWTNGGYRNPTSWAAVELAAAAAVGSIQIKTGPSPAGTRYDVQTSLDGVSWTTRLADQTNTGWNLETKTLGAAVSARFVRIFWRNSATSPQPHFSIYELVVNGEAGPTPTPTPTPSASPTPTPTPTPSATPTGAASRVSPAAVTASSTYANLSPQRAIDGNLSTQWASGGYRESEAWLAARFGGAIAFESIRIKTGALPSGVGYRLETSDDGQTWRSASGTLTNTTWNLESKPVSGEGRYLRVRFFNAASAPLARFSIFELEVYGRAATNTAPAIAEVGQSPLKIPFGGSGELFARATDADGDPLTYAWTVTGGTTTGTGARVTYVHDGAWTPYEDVNRQATVTVSDGRGGTATRTFPIDLYSGTATNYPANQTLEWAPSRTASVSLSGTTTVTVSGDLGTYDGVICEYTTASDYGRKMTILRPGTNTLPDASGVAYCYLLKYPVPAYPELEIPAPNITLSFSNGAVLTLTESQVTVIPDGAGLDLYAPLGHGGNPTPQFFIGENQARNGTRLYHRLLWVYQTPFGYTDNRSHVSYRFVDTGETVHGWSEGLEEARLFFTDSTGGASGNTGYWRIYEYTFD